VLKSTIYTLITVAAIAILVAQDILDPYAVEEMTAGNYDLALFTCTYGGKSRVTVYCDRTS
jgi:sortase A